MFRELPNVINDLTAISQITMTALEQFADQHSTIYLELRTTPKRLFYHYRDHNNVTREKCTKREYMETIISAVQKFEKTDQRRYENESHNNRSVHNHNIETTVVYPVPRLPMTCRILISVDRSQSIIEATENIDLAIALYQESASEDETYVVGVDLGGNPQQQDFSVFESLFQKARDVGLKVTIHCAEIECPSSCHCDSDSNGNAGIVESKEYKEIQRILRFRPDRIGHGVLLPKDLLFHLEELQIPVETCPTSNVMTLEMFHPDHTHDHNHESTNASIHDNDELNTTTSLLRGNNNNSNGNAMARTRRMQTIIQGLQQQHYTIQHWITNKYPIIICTDDPGIFDTNITNELYIVYHAFHQESSLSSSSFSLLDLMQLVENSINYAFCSGSIRTKIQHQLQQRLREVEERTNNKDTTLRKNIFKP